MIVAMAMDADFVFEIVPAPAPVVVVVVHKIWIRAVVDSLDFVGVESSSTGREIDCVD